jgi:chromosome segregation ATPase
MEEAAILPSVVYKDGGDDVPASLPLEGKVEVPPTVTSGSRADLHSDVLAEKPLTPESESTFDLEEGLVQSFIQNFYNSFQQCVSLMLKGSRIPFSSLKVALTRSVDNIRDVGGNERAEVFEQMISDFETDVKALQELTQASPSSLIEEEINRLMSKMQEDRIVMQNRLSELSGSLSEIKSRKAVVSTDFDMAHARIKALISDMDNARSSIEKANKMIERARDMIAKAEVVLEKSAPLYKADSSSLEALENEKLVLRGEEARVSREIAAIEAHLATLAGGLTEDMKREASIKAEEERRRKILLARNKVKSYVNRRV